MTGLLLVSTGNTRRSPMAEFLILARLRERLGDAALALGVRSAGLDAEPGDPIHPAAAAALRALGAPDGPFVSRALDAAMVQDAQLILTAARAHRDDIVTIAPDAASRTFTVRELALLLSGPVGAELALLPVGDLQERAATTAFLAAGERRSRPRALDADIDVPALSSRRSWHHRQAARLLDTAAQAIVDALAPPRPRVLHLPDEARLLRHS